MELTGYGLTLRRLEYRDIEMVRMWRNSEAVRRHMHFREQITIRMQREWFASLDPRKDFYFIIHADNYPVGLTEVKQIDDDHRSGDLGIFIADEESLAVPMLSYRAIFTIVDFAFGRLGLQRLTASVLPDNDRAIRFNESFGFVQTEGNDTELLHYILTPERYARHSKSLKSILQR